MRVVTISASYGAGGSVVAPGLAERVGLPFADRLIPALDAPPGGTVTEQLSPEEREQLARRSFLERLAHVTGGLGLPVPSAEDFRDRVRNHVEESITRVARDRGGVILGRAASVVLASHPPAFHVRLDGPVERRLARAGALEHVDLDTARARQQETDRARARYVQRLYRRDSSDPALYHLVLDSTVMSYTDCIDVIALGAKAYWRCAGIDPAAAATT